METRTEGMHSDMGTIADDARALLSATADVAGEKVGAARKRLAAALERGGKMLEQVKEKAVEGAKVTDQAIREHPYQAVMVAAGVGALFGYLIARRCACRN